MKKLVILPILTVLALPLPAQTPNLSLEIEGVQVRPGMTVDQALSAFNGKQVIRDGNQLFITVDLPTGPQTVVHKIMGILYSDPVAQPGSTQNETLAGACKQWYGSSAVDSELARVLFAAVNGPGSTETTQRTSVHTSVERHSEWTDEFLTIEVGQRIIEVDERQFHRNGDTINAVTVEECLWKPGYRPPPNHSVVEVKLASGLTINIWKAPN